jgi:hypothetical protein
MQAHAEVEQISPERQALPHPPQLEAFDEVSTQVPAADGGQSATGDGLQAHDPALHVPRPQSCPHAPQLALLVERSTQAVPHLACPAGHAHWPDTQLAPVGQVTLQAPQ